MDYTAARDEDTPAAQRETYRVLEDTHLLTGTRKSDPPLEVRRIVVHSTGNAKGQQRAREKRLAKARQDLDKLQRGAGGRYYNTAEKIAARIGVITKTRRVSSCLRTRMKQHAARFDTQADVLRCLIAEREGITASVAHSARRMTDAAVVRSLLDDAPNELLRHTALVVLSRRRLESVTCQGHLGRGCRPACDDVAWLLCFLLDPPVRRMWELHQGDVAWLVKQALDLMGQEERPPAEAVE